MPWAKIDDQYPDHPKIVEVGPLGLALHVAAICYCARYLTDGFVPSNMIPRLISFDGIVTISNGVSNAVTNKQITDELVRVNLFEIVPGGFMVHDYMKYNPSGADVKKEREENAARQKKWREEHRDKDGKYVSNDERNALLTSAPSPYPSPLLKKEESAEPPLPETDLSKMSAFIANLCHMPEATGGPDVWYGALKIIKGMGATEDHIRRAFLSLKNGKKEYTIVGPQSLVTAISNVMQLEDAQREKKNGNGHVKPPRILTDALGRQIEALP